MKIVWLALGLWVSFPGAHAQIYKWVTEDGKVIYSDRPQQDAERVTLDPLQTYEAPAIPQSAREPEGASGTEAAGYSEFSVSRPAVDEVIRSASGSVSVAVTLAPGLRPGHTVEFFIDGELVGSGKSTILTVDGIHRGTHSVSAAVVDTSGKRLQQADAVTFHLKTRGG